MSDEESLNDILTEATPKGESAAPPAATGEKSAIEKTETKAEKPVEKPAEKVAEKAAVPPEKPPEKPADKPRADVAAIIDERRKRQAAEARIKELEGKPAKPSVFDDEDKAIAARVDESTRPLRETLYKQSVKIARLQYKDAYEEAEQAFIEAADKDDRLITGLRASDDPGDFIYSTGMQIKELADVGGDFVKYREKLTGDLKSQVADRDGQIAALKAEIEGLKKSQEELEKVPPSLNSRPSGAPKAADLEDEDDISSIVRFNQRKSG